MTNLRTREALANLTSDDIKQINKDLQIMKNDLSLDELYHAAGRIERKLDNKYHTHLIKNNLARVQERLAYVLEGIEEYIHEIKETLQLIKKEKDK